MMMVIGDYPFEGPHRSVKKIENRPGVFAVICEELGAYYLLDIDHSEDVRKSILNHERSKCWEKYRRGLIRYVVLYEKKPSSGSKEDIEKRIRKKYKNIPCGSKINPPLKV